MKNPLALKRLKKLQVFEQEHQVKATLIVVLAQGVPKYCTIWGKQVLHYSKNPIIKKTCTIWGLISIPIFSLRQMETIVNFTKKDYT